MSAPKNGLDARFILPDLKMLIKLAGSQSEAARRLGMSEGWVRGILTGRRRHVEFWLAQRVGETLRGGRELDEQWRQDERAAEIRATQRTREANARRRDKQPPGRYQVLDDHNVCTHCGGRLQSPHALWMHSKAKHDDRTQGKQWDHRLNA